MYIKWTSARKRKQRQAELFAFMSVMTETLLNASLAAQKQLKPLLEPGTIMSHGTFSAIDQAAFELKWASEYVIERLRDNGVTLEYSTDWPIIRDPNELELPESEG